MIFHRGIIGGVVVLAALGFTLWFCKRRRGNKGDIDLLEGKGPMAIVEPFPVGGESPSRGGGDTGEPFRYSPLS